jgi:hypothetical protein
LRTPAAAFTRCGDHGVAGRAGRFDNLDDAVKDHFLGDDDDFLGRVGHGERPSCFRY